MANKIVERALQLALTKHPKIDCKTVQYGTAGFRSKAEDLDFIMYRMGLLAVLRSRVKDGATIGVMITASHNPVCDNGVKLIDPQGEMLEQSWEEIATRLVNVKDAELDKTLISIISENSIDMEKPASVFTGQDTRPSSPALSAAVADGASAFDGVTVNQFGVVTTPMLHYLVKCKNTNSAYGDPTIDGYYNKLVSAFRRLRGEKSENNRYIPHIIFDGANGVGAESMKKIARMLGDNLRVDDYNVGDGLLNHMCGADFVKVQQKPPENVPVTPDARCVSVDGDADRIVYFYTDSNGKFHLLDGDKIGTLVAGYLKELVTASGLALNLGLVQTAYANGSSTNYISNTLNVTVACVSTGVKHLHHRAVQFDIGVYFEANGHGTVVFSDRAVQEIEKAAKNSSLPSSQSAAAGQLVSVIDVINQTVGDALSDLLLVETILHARGWSIGDWDAVYSDLPNRQHKVTVQDRNLVQTADAERQCTSPKGLQEQINNIVSSYPNGRSFVRPSGTEDVVRIYAEANTQKNADDLAYKVALKAYELGQGVGQPPQPIA